MKKTLMPLAAGLVLLACSPAKKGTVAKTNAAAPAAPPVAKTDSVKAKIKPFKEVITDKAVSQTGLFNVHRVDQRWYFEIKNSLLDKDLLVVNRVSKAPVGRAGGYAGDWISESVVEFAKGPNDKIFLKRISYIDRSADSTENGLMRSILNSSVQPIVAAFDIKAFSTDSSGVVIDITDYISSDNDVLFFHKDYKTAYALSALQADKSYIENIRSYPLNTEIRTVKTYNNAEGTITFELNNSFVMLPEEKMKPRHMDERVGFFSRGYINFDAPRGVEVDNMITRWKLEPKAEDVQKYLAGQLVEPKKPIIFYIDPATPKKWVPYLIQGVNDWQKAFEKAGFKNAIYALEAPVNNPDWNIDDARHSVIVYKASPIQNASGPHVSDPRTGEILESHINWYHNIQQLMHDWYFTQAGVLDPRGRKMEFDDELMGKLVRYVCAHEVGHTLGLQHNFMASSSVPVDSLRSKTYVAKNGHTPSIMDYARFNYVAQPEDGIDTDDLIPRIGAYDEWAIEWGYRWFPGFKNEDAEKTFFNKWIIERVKKDHRLAFLNNGAADPRNQMEDLGDDAIKASTLGIRNLKRVVDSLERWSYVPNGNYKNYGRMFDNVMAQYNRYLGHVANNIGLMKWNPATVEQGGDPFFSFQDREKIRSAVQFFNRELFTTPEWLYNTRLFLAGTGSGLISLQKKQESVISALTDGRMWNWLFFNETSLPKGKSYSYDELLDDFEAEFFKELNKKQPIDIARRNLQKTYVVQLLYNVRVGMPGMAAMLEYGHILIAHLEKLHKQVSAAIPGYADPQSKQHLAFIRDELAMMLKYQKTMYPEENTAWRVPNAQRSDKRIVSPFTEPVNELTPAERSCWEATPSFFMVK